MRPSERYAAAVKSGYLVRPDRRERDPEWITYCMATQRPYIVITQTPQYAYLVIDCSPLAAAGAGARARACRYVSGCVLAACPGAMRHEHTD